MNLKEKRQLFEQNKQIYESVKVMFRGVEGYDVYNPSIPFEWKGKRYIFGRIERREELARSWVRLFEESGEDEWTVVPDSMIYTIEDPFVSKIGDKLVLGGTHVEFQAGRVSSYCGYFFKGEDLHDLYYFTTGPVKMKDIRLVELNDGRIGVFSRPKDDAALAKYGLKSAVGFAIIDSLNDLTPEVIANAPYIPGIFQADEWGGVNQAYLLSSGKIGVIGHICYKDEDEEGKELKVYLNMSLVFDPITLEVENTQVIGSRRCYPEGPPKLPSLADCVFVAGIEMRADGKADLYSGLGDSEVGRITIDYPFAGYGEIV